MLRRIYITGATGLLGSELVSHLLNNSQTTEIVCLVRDAIAKSRFFSEGMSSRVTLVSGDVRDLDLHRRVLGEYEIDTVFHLAAQPLVQVALRNPYETMEVNVRGTYSLLEAIRAEGTVSATVIASSDKAYGLTDGAKAYGENFPLRGRYPYDVSKTCTDLLSQAYAASYELNIAITRCGNLFGPGDLNDSRIIPTIIKAYLRSEAPIIRSNGKQVRDYLYIGDAVDAYIRLANQMHQVPLIGEAFNFSYGLQLSVLDVVTRVQKLLGSTKEPVVQNQAKNEIPFQTLDSTKARKILQWKPRFGFDEGLAKTIAWYSSQSDLKKAA